MYEYTHNTVNTNPKSSRLPSQLSPARPTNSGLIVSALTGVDELAGLRKSDGEFTRAQAAISIILIILICFVIVYHFWLAWKFLPGAVLISGGVGASRAPPAENKFLEYCFVRGVIVAHLALFCAFAYDRGESWEYYYILLAWVLSLVARFDDHLSVLWLGATTAVFLQGVGAYSLWFLSREE